MQLCLFKNTINVQDIKNADFDFFKNQKSLNYQNFNEINEYFYDYNYENPLYYHCDLSFNQIMKDNKYKYIIVEHENDSIFIMYKVIQFIKVKKIKIIDKPFSLNKNKELEKQLIDILLKKDFVSIIFKEKYLDFYQEYSFIESKQDFDYYIDFEQEYEKSFKPKYKYKKKINRFETNKDFKVEIIDNIFCKENFENLREIWKNQKNNVKNDKEYHIFIKDNLFSNKLFFNIYYKEILIFNACFVKKEDYLMKVYQSSLAKYYQKIESDTYMKNSTAHIDDVANYYLSKYFKDTKIKRYYMAGANPKHIDLIEFKENHSNGKIIYYKIGGGSK